MGSGSGALEIGDGTEDTIRERAQIRLPADASEDTHDQPGAGPPTNLQKLLLQGRDAGCRPTRSSGPR